MPFTGGGAPPTSSCWPDPYGESTPRILLAYFLNKPARATGPYSLRRTLSHRRFKAGLWLEILVQAPYYLIAIAGFSRSRRWIRVPTIVYSTILLTILPIVLTEQVSATRVTITSARSIYHTMLTSPQLAANSILASTRQNRPIYLLPSIPRTSSCRCCSYGACGTSTFSRGLLSTAPHRPLTWHRNRRLMTVH